MFYKKRTSSSAKIMLISVILHFIILLLVKIIYSATEKHSQAFTLLPNSYKGIGNEETNYHYICF